MSNKKTALMTVLFMVLSLSHAVAISFALVETITIKVEKDSSLEELMEARGYTLDDDEAEAFFREFVALNEDVSGISRIPAGTTIILPPGHLLRKWTAKEIPLVRKEQIEDRIPPSVPVVVAGAPDIPLCDKAEIRKEIATFKDRAAADKFAEDSKKLGYNLYVCRHLTDESQVSFKALLAGDIAISDDAGGYGGSRNAGITQQISGGDIQDEGSISGEILEKDSRLYHPFISVTAGYTDNISNVGTDKRSDFFTVISPGIWLGIPHGRDTLTLFDSSTRFPSGFIVERFEDEFYRHFTSSVFYQTDIDLYSKYSSENTVRHRAEGDLKYKFRGGLSVGLHDQYLVTYDVRGTGATGELNKFHSNLINLVVAYNTAKNTAIRAGFTNYMVDYTLPRNDFRDRVDNALTAAFFYDAGPKTSFFAEYQLVDISYDSNSALDGKEHLYWLGVKWNAAAKTRGKFKAGYGVKSFDSDPVEGKSLIVEGNIEHSLTPRLMLNLKAWRKTNESDLSVFRYILSNGVSLGITRIMTPRISGYVNLSYVKDYYREFGPGGGTGRRDDYYSIGLGGLYKFREWLTSEAGYIYYNRSSNLPDFDYSSSVFYLKCNLSL